MKDLLEWFKNNITTLFAFLGIFLTIYFSIFHIPDYVTEMQDEKIKSVNNSLIENIQELVYNRHKLEIGDLKSMIKGKELKHNVIYPYSIEELIMLTQERFIENKFIPLKERTRLIAALDSIKLKTSTLDTTIISKPKEESKFLSTNILGLLAGLVGVILGVLGILSTSIKLKREKEVSLELDINKREDEIQDTIKNSIEYEKIIEEILSAMNVDFQKASTKHDYGYDFFVNTQRGNYTIEVKYRSQSRNISSRIIHQLIGIMSRLNSRGILITNVDVAQSAKNIIKEYNLVNRENTVSIISGEDKEELKEQLRKLLVT